MSQVDYLHFFNSLVVNIIGLIITYFCICIAYVQEHYKILRIRVLASLIIKEVFYENGIIVNNYRIINQLYSVRLNVITTLLMRVVNFK